MAEVALFIDLENITTSLWRIHQQNPDPFKWMEKARSYGSVAFARAYGDFSQGHLARLENDLRASGIDKFDCPTKQRGDETQSTVDTNIVIDLFEVALDRPNVGTIILMAGDSDYIRVVTRLRNRLGRDVVIRGVPGSVSRELVRAAGREDPLETVDPDEGYDFPALVRIIDRFERSRRENVVPVFTHLHRYLADSRNDGAVRPELAQQVLNELVREGVLVQPTVELQTGETIRATKLDRSHPDVVEVLGPV